MQIAENLAKKYKMKQMGKVSAKTGGGVEKTFKKILENTVESVIETVQLKDIYMVFMLHIDENFDEDLL